MAEIGISVAAKTAEYTVDPIARQFGYMWDYKSNFQNLEKQVQELQSRRDIVQHAIDEETKNGKEIEEHVVNWLNRVNEVIAEAEKIITDNNQANMRCFKRWCPDLKKRYQHSKKAAVMAKDVSELENEGKFDRISYRTNPKETWHPSSKLYEDFESRRSIVDDILNELRHPGVKMVGVHGMGGIGKTTLAREVGKQAEEQKLFDAVVFVEISEKPDTIKIQEAIADKLGLEFRERSESGKAMILWERLKKESKLLLILDNIWKGLELDKVGIPFGNDHPGCKLLMTARSIDVLSNDMNSQNNFPIDGLNEKEAWDLFKKVAGACIEQDNLQSLAFAVANRCGGLPIAIVTIAKALKDKPVHAWRNALRELKRPSSDLVGSVTAQTYSCIWLSYNHLETDELKSTFLLCSTMGFASYASVEELLRYGMGLRLFKIAYTMEEARDRVNTLVQKLKESSLLLDHPNNGWFSIHDVVHDVGRVIASKDENKISLIGDVIPWELKDKNIMKNCTSLSLYDITELPNVEFNCPTLEFLYMERNSNSSEIPDNFFRGMPNLRVLHLMEMELSPLPTSLGCLVNLRTLCLNWYLLWDIGFMEDMKELEILVLSCEIEQLPKEVGQLTQLRVLDLSMCFGLEIIPPNTISRLTKLEELYMPCHFNQWQVEGVDSGRSNVSLEELKDLSQLTALQICIKDAKIVPKGLFSQKLQRYEIHIGANQRNYFGWGKTSRFLALEYNDSIYVENIVFKQLKGIKELYLIGKQGVENVLNELNRDDFPQLKHFDVQGNTDLVYIVDSSKQLQPCDAFPRLETLSIRNVISLEKICHGELMPNSFCRLRNIKVEDCDKLKNFFSFTIAGHLSKLQEIEVTDCENMEEFFTMGRRNEVIILERLQFLCLKNLPKLRRFCSEAEVASSSDQEKQMLDPPMPFFDGKVEFPNLKTLELRKMNVDKMWHNQLSSMSSSFQNLTDLVISNCCNLKYIFASSTLSSFVQLQCLKVFNCKVLEEIIRIDYLGNNVELPSLKKLLIEGCPEMKEFIFGDKVSFPSLEEIEIHNCMKFEVVIRIDDGGNNVELKSLKILSIKGCPEMKAFNFGDKVSFPSLEEVEIHNCMKFGEVIRIDDRRNNVELSSLKKLSIKKCLEMKAFIFGDKVSFPSLEEIEIHNCMKFEVVIRIDDGGNNVELKSLKKLSIKECPEMKAFNFDDKVSFPSLEEIEIHNCMKFEVVIRIDDGGNNVELKSLKKLSIKECPEMKAFNFGDKVSFPSLEEIEIHNCMKFEVVIRIDDGGNNVELKSLKKLSIKECPEMKAFNFGDKVIRIDDGGNNVEFPSLKIFLIRECHKMKAFIFSDKVSFPSLEEIKIYNCMIFEEVIRIDDGGNNVELPSLKKLLIEGCPEMKVSIFNDKVEFPNLKTLQLCTINVEKIWHNQLSSMSFCLQNLTDLIISDCCNLKYIFASSTLTSFVQLQRLEIRNCKVLEEIIRIDDLKYNVELLSLKKLSIEGCPEMKAFVFGDKDFCSGNIHNFNFPSLEIFKVSGCLKMNIFSSVEASTPMLRKMNLGFMIFDCKGDINTTIQHIQHMQRHIYENEPFQPTRAPVPAPGHSHSQAFNASEDLPKTVIRTLNQGSSPMSMDFHPVQQTLLLVGTNVGDIGLWEVGSRERLVLKNFKVWDLSACTMPLQAALVKDPGVSVNRVKWGPGGSLFGVAYSRHIVHIHAYNGGDDVRRHLEIDAHVGGVNDLAFSHPIKQLCVITCGDDKTIKVWDAATGAKQYIFEGHDAPVYSVCPHYMENIQVILSTALDGKIKAWLYDNFGSRVDLDAPGRWCTTMAYSADGTRLFSCGTSKDGESYIVEWNESEGTIKSAYQGLHKRSVGVVQFDTTKNRFLAAGHDFSIKFWDMDNERLLNSIDADGGLPISPHIRFNKDGSLLAVSANENGIKILANSEGMRLLRNYETLSYDALRTSGASKPAINPISAAATSAGLADRGASVVSIAGMNGDARSLGDVKPRMTEESNDKSKIWKLTEINEPSQCP